MNKRLDGKTALITGGSKGLGKAMAQALAESGARVILVSRNMDELQQAAGEVRALGSEVHAIQADVRLESEVQNIQRQVAEAGLPVHILINNAGMNIRQRLTDFTLEEWSRVLDTNLTSVFLMCRAFVPQMKGRGYGRVINLSSIMGWISLPGRGAYSASKSALFGLTRALALEEAKEGITVNCISPGPFATPMNTVLMENPEMNQFFLDRIPVGRWGKVEEIGQLAVYLCSEEAGFVTGTDILIDGGWVAQ